MIAVQVQTEPELIVGRPQKLFEGQGESSRSGVIYSNTVYTVRSGLFQIMAGTLGLEGLRSELRS